MLARLRGAGVSVPAVVLNLAQEGQAMAKLHSCAIGGAAKESRLLLQSINVIRFMRK
jgi:hypothetical protein